MSDTFKPLRSVAGATDNEGTAYPFWLIAKERKDGQLVYLAGPFFSREKAERHLEAKRHNYGDKAIVWCASGHNSKDFVALYMLSQALQDAETFYRLHAVFETGGTAQTGQMLSAEEVPEAVAGWLKKHPETVSINIVRVQPLL